MSDNTLKGRNKLPSLYKDNKPTKGGKLEPLKLKSSSYEFSSQHDVNSEASDWIHKLQGPAGSFEYRASFFVFHSKMGTAISSKSISQLLPLLPDSVNTSATVRHCALIIKSITEKLNPDQIPVIVADQPSLMEVSRVVRKFNLNDGTSSY